MTVLFEKIDTRSDGVVEFYTVKFGDKNVYEFEDFENKEFPKHQSELEILYNVINEMNYRGAKKYYFKFEENADALPIIATVIIQVSIFRQILNPEGVI